MTYVDPLHPEPFWVPSGVDLPIFFPNDIPPSPGSPLPIPSIPEGHAMYYNARGPASPGDVVCCHATFRPERTHGVWAVTPDVREMNDSRKGIWTVVESRPRDHGRGAFSYDILVIPGPDVVCPLCLLKDVMES